MRLIEADLGEVRSVVVSPDARLVAASGTNGWCAVFDWASGETVRRYPLNAACDQLAFGPNHAMIYVQHGVLRIDHIGGSSSGPDLVGQCVTAAIAPDGKTLVATQAGTSGSADLKRWSLPARQPLAGFNFWSPFRKLAFSPDGQFLAGIWSEGFELRFAVTGGLDYRHRISNRRWFATPGFVSFTRDSGTCAFGWENEFHILDISTGTSKALHRVDAGDHAGPIPARRRQTVVAAAGLAAPFHDAAFTGSGHYLATVEQPGRWKRWGTYANVWEMVFGPGANRNGRLKLRNPQTWDVVREYDWDCGPLTCLAFTTDGSAGVCGTADGRLVQFDVDE
ncbi:wd-40 repeat protein : Putative WD-40 repeat protein OS=Streptomyces bingchenggensis (strain BCW-1) GN=SBI_05196 PE=4 SV=1 [Gemmata massiliana]|uniref:Wd-40 repeat protein: Putative WD-40 repeat protein n=1 Tax=Gemmata massiliana TaxID=1210884 RepID=A0A6P2CW75_9BACT|nr:hypothetical protein [Gemmata massiliana]VTR91352.1 wd-40 repeat protein : Putative WD-40 repeat protein OS=Streptomyces bingchenggensis (strain BCW-1) GN=SBI_05196 PE=4 SV=1 [Gemmata massiliana]